MATRRVFRQLVVDRVDLVDAGANPDAHITLFKRAEGVPADHKEHPSMADDITPEGGADLDALAEVIEAAKAEGREAALADVASLDTGDVDEAPAEDIDKSALPAEVRKALDDAEARADAAAEIAKAAQEQAAELFEERQVAKFAAEAASFEHLADDRLASVLRAVAEADVDAHKALTEILAAADGVAKGEVVFGEFGKAESPEESGTDAIRKAAREIAESEGISLPEAMVRAAADNPAAAADARYGA